MTDSTSLKNIALRLDSFARKWAGHGDERQDTQRYWIDLLTAVGATDPTGMIRFETRVASNGYADVWIPEASLLVEQKSLGVDPLKPEPRQGVLKTPIRQALDYANAIPLLSRPRWLGVCMFDRLLVWDTDSDPLCKGGPETIMLAEYAAHADRLVSLLHGGGIRSRRSLSVEASRLVARLHDALWSLYKDHGEQSHHDLAVLTVRLVFLMYAQDAHVLGAMDHPFTDYVKARDAQHLRAALLDLLDVLETPVADRDPYLTDELKAFPYVDGGLFSNRVEIPLFDDAAYRLLLECLDFDWSDISPVVFGSLMEETLSHDERRRGGMHYTSVENIHRVIDPLFLDMLQEELDGILKDGKLGHRARMNRLDAYRQRLASLNFLDPAAGSGNFLTETYLSLRRLENTALKARYGGQIALPGLEPILVSLKQFHGIEINDFAVCVARTALWIAEQQMASETESIIGLPVDRLPLSDEGTILQGNALRVDWNTVLSGSDCDYVIGNPPFLGHDGRSHEQTAELKAAIGPTYDGYMDYCAAWWMKAGDYLTNPDGEFAFVSTSSICQGRPVPALFEPLRDKGWSIRFARHQFPWESQSNHGAAVAVIVAGMTRGNGSHLLYDGNDARPVDHINAYLADGVDVFVKARFAPLSPTLTTPRVGSYAKDDGALIITEKDIDTFRKDSTAAKYLRPLVGAKELIRGRKRWCLWLADAEPGEMRRSPLISERLDRCRRFREASIKKETREAAKTPWLFEYIQQPTTDYLAIPRHFTVGREYMTCDWRPATDIVTNACFSVLDPDGLQFAVIESRMFMTWQKTVGGYLGDAGCRFSNTVVWNNLPLPKLDDDVKAKLIAAGGTILDVRAKYPDSTLADLYDPRFMPADLRHAHETLDRVADVAFGADRWLKDDDDARLALLFASYARLIGKEG
ncbi:DNA methyltransferase [Bifidobacterium sp. SO1]|uniref:DNA methyltransferase n=1 Tax=Bifidobacterium sp. SO1 TaxID=2809029 RepID=UPI001F0A7385|nr:DNA methyltransferase [Bifidobacterium sp. SO1]